MSEELDLETCRPPLAPLPMPYQVLERQQEPTPTWLVALRRSAARRAPHE